MKKYAVADTGPLIILYQIEVLDFLQELYDEIFIPEAVKHELLKGVSGYKILSRQWIKIKTVKNKEVLKILKIYIDEGEAEAIQLARELKATIIIDERKGRRIAKSLNLKIRGTLGILLELKKKNIITAVKPYISKMFEKGYYLDDKLVKEILEKANET